MENNIFSAAATAQLLALVRTAGAAVLEFYNQQDAPAVELKKDESPLTAADLAAHRLLTAGLPAILDIPIISEEGVLPAFAERAGWPRYWLIDPLDGTKEFLARNDQFTVNIALVEQGVPTLGVVHVPVGDVTYVGLNPLDGKGTAAHKYTSGVESVALAVRSLAAVQDAGDAFTAVTSRRHGLESIAQIADHIRRSWPAQVDFVGAGSSLKFCLVAEGKADFYPRLSPTAEWDTAAAQAVLEAAGGAVINADALAQGQWQSLRYNQREDINNPSFYAVGDVHFDWASLLKACH